MSAILNLPFSVDDDCDIYDATGCDIASVWLRSPNGRYPRCEEDQQPAVEHKRTVAAEIARRVNLHDELVEVLRYLGNEGNWIDADDGLTLKRPGGGRQAGIVLYSHDIKPWVFLRDIIAKVEAR